MKYRNLEGINKKMSSLVFGTGVSLFTNEGNRETAFACLDMAWDAGFRVFDTGHAYGDAENKLGAWLEARGHRDEAVILDKGCNPGQKGCDDVFSAKTIAVQIEESLQRLRTDHVELYILHRDEESEPVGEIVEILNELKETGKIGRFGGSNWKLNRVLEANAYAKEHNLTGFTVASPCFNLADYVHDPWGRSVTISGKENQPYRDWLENNQMPVFNYSSLARGFLSGKYRTDGEKPIEACLPDYAIEEYYSPSNVERLRRAELLAAEKGCSVSQIGLAWLFAQPLNLFPIVSPTKERHILDNVGALEIQLSREEADWLLTGER
ncbi:MAG: aldo/keto reductase [Candidatus Choladocola sp.]|nr:aldo/keto reductase [Candidatus Choladocola sp.]